MTNIKQLTALLAGLGLGAILTQIIDRRYDNYTVPITGYDQTAPGYVSTHNNFVAKTLSVGDKFATELDINDGRYVLKFDSNGIPKLEYIGRTNQ